MLVTVVVATATVARVQVSAVWSRFIVVMVRGLVVKSGETRGRQLWPIVRVSAALEAGGLEKEKTTGTRDERRGGWLRCCNQLYFRVRL
ncbi:hypothetical protein M6B38_217890 [Iris pallida]|uniref:Secreted protein n=1 Tax=Iris pallida TaxID=29817 RepID=A0AAX6E0U6_IRIPA|nr:hypothetical protein M6B38_217890 [Iris pallida]